MPIPTWAVLIMLTSLAPSPIAIVVHLFLRINQTISCFCLGVTRQQIIALHPLTSYSNSFYSTGLRRSSPVATRQHCLRPYSCFILKVYSIFYCHYRTAISVSTSPQEMPIFIAVYFLSPVNIQTLTPARRIFSMVPLTLS